MLLANTALMSSTTCDIIVDDMRTEKVPLNGRSLRSAPAGTPTSGLVTDAMMSEAAMLGQLVHWKSRAVSLIRFCMLNGSRTALKPSSLMRRITFTMSAQRGVTCQPSRAQTLVVLENCCGNIRNEVITLEQGVAPKLRAVGPW